MIPFTPPPPPAPSGQVIALHARNPHYFVYRGRPIVLVSSGEHYGAVLNGDFDYVRYLNALKSDGLNLTRTFSGVYCEVPGSFGIKNNTLAPKPERFLAPWQRIGSRFDLNQWSEAYFRRLKGFINQAGKRGIMVEFVLFCPFYEDSMWSVSPMNAANNVNGIGTMARTEVYTLRHPEQLAIHDAFVRKVVRELNGFGNLYYEVCNEPYFGGVAGEWQDHIIETITSAESKRPVKHLIARNIANGSARIENPNPSVSIFNFHYAAPPDAVRENSHLNRPIAFDETGFKGSDDFTYRSQAWHFMMAGGAVFDNLDYSFSVQNPDGTAQVSAPTPGGGSPALRKQLGFLKRFMDNVGLATTHPLSSNELRLGSSEKSQEIHGLGRAGRIYGLYVSGGKSAKIELEAPVGRYRIEWMNPESGEKTRNVSILHPGGKLRLITPEYSRDLAIRIVGR